MGRQKRDENLQAAGSDLLLGLPPQYHRRPQQHQQILNDPGAFTAPYNFHGAPAKFPDVDASDVCIPCHAGRESGETINTIADFTNASFKNSHYRAAAGLMYVKIGFTDFIDPNTPIGTSTYGKSLTSTEDGGALSSTHRKLGTPAINGDSHNPAVFTPGNFDSNGPCVTCHMQATGQPTRITSHSFDISPDAFNQVCINCHDYEGGVPLTGANFLQIFVEPQKEIFVDAWNLSVAILLKNYNISYTPTYPYFYDLAKGTRLGQMRSRTGHAEPVIRLLAKN